MPRFEADLETIRTSVVRWWYYYYIIFKVRLTFPCVMAPTMAGTRKPGKVAIMLVMPIKMPAKLGAMSLWLAKTPENIVPKKVVATTIRTTTLVLSQPEKQTPTKHAAGMTEAERKMPFYVVEKLNPAERLRVFPR